MHRLVAVVLALSVCASVHADSVGKTICTFTLPDTSGNKVDLDKFEDKKAVVVFFLGIHCPINNLYMPRLTELHKEYADKGVQFLAINSNEHDDLKAVAAHAAKHKLPFPVLRDDGQVVADQFGAERVPEVFILNPKLRCLYQGRIDDQFGIGFVRPKATRRDFAEALDEVLAGKKVSEATTPVAGCYIARAPRKKVEGETITYAKHISRIVQNRCQECHRPGQIGPMPLMTYEDVSSWAAMIQEVVSEKRMPPWHADPAHGDFGNNRSLSDEDRQTLLAWIDKGCPKGDDKDLPPAKKYIEGWSIGAPDHVFTMVKAFDVPAAAPREGIKYQYFVVPTNFEEDMWIQAAEAKPGNRAVVHHIIVYMVMGGKKIRGEDGIGDGFLVAYVPGDAGIRFPEGMAKKLPKGASLVFQMHYTPNGVAGTDKSSVALVLAKAPPKHEMKTRAISQQFFVIPPGAGNHRVASMSTFKKDTMLFSLFPHMHLRGKSFEYRIVYPDGKKETLLSVPRYDFNWQDSYVFKTPLMLPAGSRIECTAHFDNSEKNASNPDPKAFVRWGDQTWEEMMIGFVDYAYVEGKGGKDKGGTGGTP